MTEKLHKVLANAGIGSRREIERWIAAGRITVGNKTAKIGDRIATGATVKIDGRPVPLVSRTRTARVLVYHKPVGEICTRHDPHRRPTVFRRLPPVSGGRWISVGRLDLNTSGLLLFTNDGEFADRLMHPRAGVEREYLVRVSPPLTDAQKTKLMRGIRLEEGCANVLRIQAGRGTGGRNRWYRVVLTQGRYREVRRLCEAVGASVSRLIRIRYGSVRLPRDLRAGAWMELQSDAIDRLAAQCTRQPPGRIPIGH